MRDSILLEITQRNVPEIWSNDWILHRDNAPAYKALYSSSWPKKLLLNWNTHPLSLIWLRMTCG
jgi:hypothetical protein